MATYDLPSQNPSRESVLLSEEYIPRRMPAILGTMDMTSLYLMVIFFIVNAVTAANGGPSAFTFLLLGGITFFIPSAIATAQLGHMFPHEGSLYNWTHRAFGGYWSFFIGFCAWFPGVLVIVAGADTVVSFLQGLNSNWLVQPWQQGVAIAIIIALSGIISVQRLRLVQIVVNVGVGLIFLAVLILGLATLIWLLQGHHSATDFSQWSDWAINWNPQSGNISLFGLITLAYLGTDAPLNMAGEIKNRGVVAKHVLWGTVLVFVGYFIATTALLVIMGSAKVGSTGNFSLVMVVDAVFGKFAGDVVVICLLSFFVITTAVYNYVYARLLLVASVDKRLPKIVGKINKNRAPVNAIRFQTIVAIAFAIIVFVIAPYVINLGNPAALSIEVYNVSVASATLVWAISTAFLFINIIIFYFRDRANFRKQRIVPMPLLAASVIVGPIACLLAIVDTLFFSWIGAYISNAQWWYIIGGVTLTCIIIAAIGSMFASSEATWETMEDN